MAALDAGAHVVLEGPPGTGKSTLLRAVAGGRDGPFFLVEGNAELTPARLVGHFDPAQVLAKGYDPEIFVDGPLVEALRTGGLLYVEEINRVPEETLNVLHHRDERGRAARAAARGGAWPPHGFRLVAAMNPFDAVGTARISSAIYDRTCRIAMGYQSGGHRDRDRRAARRRAVDRGVARRRSSSSCAARRDAPRHPDRLVGARRDRPRRHRRPAGRCRGGAGRPTGTSGWTRRWSRCPAGSGCSSRAPGPPEDVVRELYERGVRRRTDRRRMHERRDGTPGEA